MGGKGKKKGKNKKQAASAVAEEGIEENGEGNGSTKKGKGGKGKKGKAGKSSKFQGDILSDSAMENAYYICHNLMDILKVSRGCCKASCKESRSIKFSFSSQARGFQWPESQKKKKKGKK